MSRINFHVNLRLHLSLTLKLWTSLQFSPCSQKKTLKSGGLILVLCVSDCPQVDNSRDMEQIFIQFYIGGEERTNG